MSTVLPIPAAPQGVPVEVVESTERWSDYRLADGVVLRAKVTIISAVRLEGQYDNDGRPMYAMNAAINSAVISAPPDLMKK